ncbi:tRNA-intron lyase [Candidatus Woesearchaeota archaeon]|nr:tRNA-intron lyase [Candidatus Woesearchaeota archaeon]
MGKKKKHAAVMVEPPKGDVQEVIGSVELIKGSFANERVLAEIADASRNLYDQSRFGEPYENKIQYSLVEALYLVEKKKLEVYDSKNKAMPYENFIKLATSIEPKFWVRYCVYRDMRSRGYIVKTALKFGADFRVYDRGVKPGEDHARWILYPVHETEMFSWYEFSAKNRVAHSTKKHLLIACVDGEGDVTYWELSWIRP